MKTITRSVVLPNKRKQCRLDVGCSENLARRVVLCFNVFFINF